MIRHQAIGEKPDWIDMLCLIDHVKKRLIVRLLVEQFPSTCGAIQDMENEAR